MRKWLLSLVDYVCTLLSAVNDSVYIVTIEPMKVNGGMGDPHIMPIRPHLHPEETARTEFRVVAALGWEDRFATDAVSYRTIV